MPIPANSVHVVFSGTMAGGEEFATGFWLGTNTPMDQAGLQVLVDSIETAWVANGSAQWRVLIPASHAYTMIRAYQYTNGDNNADLTAENPIAVGAGTGASALLPLGTAMVLSLRTGLPGRTKRGRMYLPFTSSPLDATSHNHTIAGAQSLATATAAFFTAVNQLSNVGAVVVVSKTTSTSQSVTQVIVDTRPDSQRRRTQSAIIAGRGLAAVSQ